MRIARIAPLVGSVPPRRSGPVPRRRPPAQPGPGSYPAACAPQARAAADARDGKVQQVGLSPALSVTARRGEAGLEVEA